MRRVAVLTVFSLVVHAAPTHADTQTKAAPPSPFNGTKWSVTMTPDTLSQSGGEGIFEDTLSFSDGAIASVVWGKRGFTSLPYTWKAGPQDSFKVKLADQEQGKMTWVGEASRDSIHGTINWTRKDGTLFMYRFEGKKLPPAPSASTTPTNTASTVTPTTSTAPNAPASSSSSSPSKASTASSSSSTSKTSGTTVLRTPNPSAPPAPTPSPVTSEATSGTSK